MRLGFHKKTQCTNEISTRTRPSDLPNWKIFDEWFIFGSLNPSVRGCCHFPGRLEPPLSLLPDCHGLCPSSHGHATHLSRLPIALSCLSLPSDAPAPSSSKTEIRIRPFSMSLRFRDPAPAYTRRDGRQRGCQEASRTSHSHYRTR